MGLRALQHLFVTALAMRGAEVEIGPLVIISQSAHLYEDCWERADALILSDYQRLARRRRFADPSGSFAISIQKDLIHVERLAPGDGEVVGLFRGRSAMRLGQDIALDCAALEVDHALYLGAELQKAEAALRLGRPDLYRQDRPLSYGAVHGEQSAPE
jgi:thymidylate synthase